VSESTPAPPPVEGLHREVEVMFDGKRRITFYSREIAEAPAAPEPGAAGE
jgi:hypothetical protein